MCGRLRSATAIAEQPACKRWAKRWWDDVFLGREQRHPRPMRVPTFALVEQDGQAPHDPELPIQFREDRWICNLPPLAALERQLSIQFAEGLRRLEPSQLDVLKLVMSKRSITSRQLSDAIPHFGAERRCAEVGFTKERKVMLRAISSISSKVTADSLIRDKSIRIAGWASWQVPHDCRKLRSAATKRRGTGA